MSSFIDEVKKVKNKRKAKIKNSYGSEDYQIYYKRKYNTKIKLSLFSSIFRDCIKQLIDDYLMQYLAVRLPSKLGEVHIEKYFFKPQKNKKGNWIKLGYPNWSKTLDLWEHDEEAKQNKIIVKEELPCFHRIVYETKRWDFYNHQFFKLKAPRKLYQRMHQELTLNKKFRLWQSDTYQ